MEHSLISLAMLSLEVVLSDRWKKIGKLLMVEESRPGGWAAGGGNGGAVVELVKEWV